jgi:3-phosphoshikimate 1-carboxyvinyltransferase
MTHRYLIVSALADGISLLMDPLHSDDTIATVEGLRKLGTKISNTGDWEIEGGKLSPPGSIINCNESGTTIRLLIGLTSLLDTSCTLTGALSLLRRPNKPLLEALEQLGVQTESNAGYPPITITGKIKGGRADIPGNISSQFISSILLAAPYSESPVELNITTPLESKPYVQMTLDTMKKSGIKVQHSENLEYFKIPNEKYIPQKTRIEGDWSSATYMLAAGALAGKVQVDNLDLSTSQADIEIISIMNEMGANIKIKENQVTVEKTKLNAINVDLSDYPDLFPMLACLCSVAEGTSKLTGLTRLKIKESDRMVAIIEGLNLMGIEISGDHDSVRITGGLPHGAVIDTHNDHRIAMSFAILSHAADGETTIINPECVSKSYPDFWETLIQIGAKVR